MFVYTLQQLLLPTCSAVRCTEWSLRAQSGGSSGGLSTRVKYLFVFVIESVQTKKPKREPSAYVSSYIHNLHYIQG